MTVNSCLTNSPFLASSEYRTLISGLDDSITQGDNLNHKGDNLNHKRISNGNNVQSAVLIGIKNMQHGNVVIPTYEQI